MMSIAADTQSSATVTDLPALTALDRCDHCGAQAYHRVILAAGELLFCAHHGRELRDSLAPNVVHWQDESDRLFENSGR